MVGHFSTPWPTTEAVYSEQNSLCALTGYEVSKDVSKLPSNTKRLQLYASLIKYYMYAIFIQLYLNVYLIWSFKLKYLSITVLREAHMNTLYQGFKPIVNNLPLNNFTATKDREGQLISTSPLLEAAIKNIEKCRIQKNSLVCFLVAVPFKYSFKCVLLLFLLLYSVNLLDGKKNESSFLKLKYRVKQEEKPLCIYTFLWKPNHRNA